MNNDNWNDNNQLNASGERDPQKDQGKPAPDQDRQQPDRGDDTRRQDQGGTQRQGGGRHG